MTASVRATLGFALGLFAFASGAEAQVSAQRLADYRDVAERGASAFNQNDLRTARAHFERAASILPNPRIYRLLGRVALAENSFVEAAQLFHRALTIDDAGHPLSPELRRQVESELLPQARAHVAEYRLDVTPADAIVTVDGRPASITGGVLVLAPGAHTISAVAPGHARLEQRIEVRQGVQDVMRVRLARDGTSSGPVPVAVSARGPDEGLLGGGIASLVIGGVGLGVFAIAGGIAVADRGALAAGCGMTSSCAHADLAAIETLNIVADIGLASGATAAALGALLVGLAFASSGNVSGSAASPLRTNGDVVSAWVSDEGAGVTWGRRW